jgi:hypothetical protein
VASIGDETPVTLLPMLKARAMCEKCTALDGKIEHYQNISCWVNDKMTLQGIEVVIAKYRSEKKELHPENEVR